MSIGLSVQEKKRKIDFKDCRHGGHLEFLIEQFQLFLIYKSPPMLHTELQVNWPFGSGEEVKNRFLRWPQPHGSHLGFPTGASSAIFDVQVTTMLHTELQVNWSFGSGKEANMEAIGTSLAISSYRSPWCFLPSFKSIDLLVQEKKRKIDFKMAATTAILDFRSKRL